MPALFVSLGTSPAIVPEAFLLPGVQFTDVHALTTASVQEANLDFIAGWFAEIAPQTTLTFTRVADFTDFTSEQDHFRFEEVLYRWWLEKRPKEGLPHVCLSGGFKTMSAAMQKAAAVLGAEDVFHVLCNLPVPQQPKTAQEIQSAQENRHLHWIRLGPETGWPQWRSIDSAAYPLTEVQGEGCARWVKAPDTAFRDHLREIVTRSHNIAGAWDRLSNLPYPVLATWPEADLKWLNEPLDPVADQSWVAALPKIELHCHLGGFATHGELLHQVRAAAENPDRLPPLCEPPWPDSWPLPLSPVGLSDYMRLGDANGSSLLKDPGCLRRQCELLYEHLCEQNIAYAEIRCSPANYASDHRSPWTVVEEIMDAFDSCVASSAASGVPQASSSSCLSTPCDDDLSHRQAFRRHAATVNLLIIGTRRKQGDHRTALLRHIMLAITASEHRRDPGKCQIVGVDLAGFEDKETRAHYYREDFRLVHRAGLALTVHAGENDDAEGIWSAVFDLNTRRIGHALSLRDSPELLRSVADRRIAVEMCPYANFQIKGFPLDPAPGTAGTYPLKDYLDAGVPVTVNTDNIGISAATLTDNLLLAARLCPGLTRLDVLRLVRNALDQTFLSPAQRESLLAGIRIPPP